METDNAVLFEEKELEERSARLRKAKILIVDGHWEIITPYGWSCRAGLVSSIPIKEAVEMLRILMEY